MIELQNESILVNIPALERVLLISMCLRPSKTCKGKILDEGLECTQNCIEPCKIHKFRETALKLGYKGICVAAGGSMALKFVEKHKPKAIIAVACKKELEEGVQGVKEIFKEDTIAIILIPLTKTGCVDTDVDENSVMRALTVPFSHYTYS